MAKLNFLELMNEADAFSSTYVVKKTGAGEWNVTKFANKKEQESQVRVEVRKSGYWTDSPAFFKTGQADKHIKIVKQFLADKEPLLTAYQIDDKGLVTSKKFG